MTGLSPASTSHLHSETQQMGYQSTKMRYPSCDPPKTPPLPKLPNVNAQSRGHPMLHNQARPFPHLLSSSSLSAEQSNLIIHRRNPSKPRLITKIHSKPFNASCSPSLSPHTLHLYRSRPRIMSKRVAPDPRSIPNNHITHS